MCVKISEYKVAVILATYNGEKYIKEQLESIVNQTYRNISIYIRDDNSTDTTPIILEDYAKKYPDLITIIDNANKNLGVKDNFSLLLNKVKNADFYLLCDQDDVWMNNKIEVMLKYVETQSHNGYLLLHHGVIIVDEKLNTISDSYYGFTGLKYDKNNPITSLLMYNSVPGCTMMFNHKLKSKLKEIPTEAQMHDWWIILINLVLGGTIVEIHENLSLYRQHDNNIIGAYKNDRASSFKLFNLNKLYMYSKNNQVMKSIRYNQTKILLSVYGLYMDDNMKKKLERLLIILCKKNKLFALISAYKYGYTFWSLLYTIKFYML